MPYWRHTTRAIAKSPEAITRNITQNGTDYIAKNWWNFENESCITTQRVWRIQTDGNAHMISYTICSQQVIMVVIAVACLPECIWQQINCNSQVWSGRGEWWTPIPNPCYFQVLLINDHLIIYHKWYRSYNNGTAFNNFYKYIGKDSMKNRTRNQGKGNNNR